MIECGCAAFVFRKLLNIKEISMYGLFVEGWPADSLPRTWPVLFLPQRPPKGNIVFWWNLHIPWMKRSLWDSLLVSPLLCHIIVFLSVKTRRPPANWRGKWGSCHQCRGLSVGQLLMQVCVCGWSFGLESQPYSVQPRPRSLLVKLQWSCDWAFSKD